MELLLDGKWKEVKGKLKKKYGELTDDDLTYQKGMEDELFGRIEKRIGKSKTDIRREVESLINM
ncbi:MAG: CsbD family protein [Fulvivirga sp.]|uniref:CsbD family protein n=1 Tax=Fulvivirga sp. TaxID=1931237 RepID=UPI0032EC43E6